MTKRNLEARAWELLQRHELTKAPVDVERLARKQGYNLVFQHFPGDVSGTVIREADGGVTIGINTFHAENRRRFSIAHELGHAELHLGSATLFVDPPVKQFFRDDSTTSGRDKHEIEANQFAAALLMPRELISQAGKRILNDQPRTSVEDLISSLASKFGVSIQAMRYRLVNLGILEPD